MCNKAIPQQASFLVPCMLTAAIAAHPSSNIFPYYSLTSLLFFQLFPVLFTATVPLVYTKAEEKNPRKTGLRENERTISL